MPAPGITEEMICEETEEVSAVSSSVACVRWFRERGEDGGGRIVGKTAGDRAACHTAQSYRFAIGT
jgi:hypothetical protein